MNIKDIIQIIFLLIGYYIAFYYGFNLIWKMDNENKLYDNYTKEELIVLLLKKEKKIANQTDMLSSLQKTYEILKDDKKSSVINETDFGIEPNTKCFIKTNYKTFVGIVSNELAHHIKILINDKDGEFFYVIKKSSIIVLKTYYGSSNQTEVVL